MAKKEDEAGPKATAAKPGPWRVRVAAGAGFTRHHGPHRLRFVDGVAETADEAAAAHCAECGYEVEDLATGKVRNPLPKPGEKPAAAAK